MEAGTAAIDQPAQGHRIRPAQVDVADLHGLGVGQRATNRQAAAALVGAVIDIEHAAVSEAAVDGERRVGVNSERAAVGEVTVQDQRSAAQDLDIAGICACCADRHGPAGFGEVGSGRERHTPRHRNPARQRQRRSGGAQVQIALIRHRAQRAAGGHERAAVDHDRATVAIDRAAAVQVQRSRRQGQRPARGRAAQGQGAADRQRGCGRGQRQRLGRLRRTDRHRVGGTGRPDRHVIGCAGKSGRAPVGRRGPVAEDGEQPTVRGHWGPPTRRWNDLDVQQPNADPAEPASPKGPDAGVESGVCSGGICLPCSVT